MTSFIAGNHFSHCTQIVKSAALETLAALWRGPLLSLPDELPLRFHSFIAEEQSDLIPSAQMSLRSFTINHPQELRSCINKVSPLFLTLVLFVQGTCGLVFLSSGRRDSNSGELVVACVVDVGTVEGKLVVQLTTS